MKIGIIQQQNTVCTETNIANLSRKIRECAQQDAELIVLQELHNSLYFCQTENIDFFDLAETIPNQKPPMVIKMN